MDHVDRSKPGYARHRVSSLSALLLSLTLGALGIVLVLAVLGTWTVASASKNGNALNISTDAPPGFTATSAATTTVHVTKTVEPDDPDTGGIVSICFTVTGLGPRGNDVVLVQDVSGSMDEPAGEGVTQTRLAASQVAARAFVNSLPDTDRAAVVPYSDTVYMNQVLPLTATKSSILGAIDGLNAYGETNIGEGIKVSHEELITSPRHVSDTAKTMILLSDGKANRPTNETRAKEYALERAEAAARDSIAIHTIGFGSDADEELLRSIADVSGGKYFSAPEGSLLEPIYVTIAQGLHNVAIIDVLVRGIETDCSQWPNGLCVKDPGGVTTVTFPISDSMLISGSASVCFTATVNLDPGYTGPTNLPGSEICYQNLNGETICEDIAGPAIVVGGRKIRGDVFLDLNASGLREGSERGISGVGVRTSTGLTAFTDISGSYVMRTSRVPTLSVIVERLPSHVTTLISQTIPSVTGVHTVDFGIRVPAYLPVVIKGYPQPVNGGFEMGWTGWNHAGELAQTITSANPHSGSFSALLGDPAYMCEGRVPLGSAWMQQTILVPDTVSPKLSFWYDIFTEDKNPYLSREFDRFEVKISDTVVYSDANTVGLYGCEPPPKDLGWQVGVLDLSTYRGQPITIRFENRNWPDKWFNTWVYVDDVRIVP